MRNLSPCGRKACMFGTQHVGIWCCCDLLVLRRRHTKCTRVLDTNGWLVICEFEDHMHCMDEWGICSRCGRIHRIRRISRFAFEGSRPGCGPSVRACLRNWCTCVQDTRSSKRFCGSCCRMRCILLAYIRLLSVLIFRTCCTHGICTRCFSVDAQVLCIACNN